MLLIVVKVLQVRTGKCVWSGARRFVVRCDGTKFFTEKLAGRESLKLATLRLFLWFHSAERSSSRKPFFCLLLL